MNVWKQVYLPNLKLTIINQIKKVADYETHHVPSTNDNNREFIQRDVTFKKTKYQIWGKLRNNMRSKSRSICCVGWRNSSIIDMLGSILQKTECSAGLSDIKACQLCLLGLRFDSMCTTHISTVCYWAHIWLIIAALRLLSLLLCSTVKLSVLRDEA